MKQLIYIFLVFFLFISCSRKGREEVDVSGIPVSITIQRLDQEMMRCKSPADVQAFLQKYPDFKRIFLQTDSTQSDTTLVNTIYTTLQNEGFQKLYRDVQNVYGDIKEVKTQLEDAYKHIKYYYPDFKAPKVQTAMTGLGSLSKGQDLYVSDSLVIIGLDFYLGEKNATYVPDAPQYVMRRFQKPFIVPQIVLFLSQKYNRADPKDPALLAEMIFYGKAFEFAATMQPSVPDSIVSVIFSANQLEEAEENKAVVWAHFLKEKLLYETNHFKKVKYIGERPYTAEISAKCPGAIGRWLGWEIVKKYRREHPEVSLPELMQNPQAQQIFEGSNYKGS